MCLACSTMPHRPLPPASAMRFSFAPQPTDWSCYPSNQLQKFVPPPPIVKKKEAKEAKKEEKPAAKEEKKTPKVPTKPSLKPGASYVYGKSTVIHLIRDTKIWEKGTGFDWTFKRYQIPVSMSVDELIEAMTEGKGEGMALTEVVELGDGDFSKVSGRTPSEC